MLRVEMRVEREVPWGRSVQPVDVLLHQQFVSIKNYQQPFFITYQTTKQFPSSLEFLKCPCFDTLP